MLELNMLMVRSREQILSLSLLSGGAHVNENDLPPKS